MFLGRAAEHHAYTGAGGRHGDAARPRWLATKGISAACWFDHKGFR
ncbi:hypothetical protein EV13_1367 [Prochlorococcus sp. MIT 0702]|nr:hypothetical protein EV13_1367 [Prochlorococcus sp. MIT 0702]